MIDDFKPGRRALRGANGPKTNTTPDSDDEPVFQPPELYTEATDENPGDLELGAVGKPKQGLIKRLNLTRKKMILIGVGVFVVLGGSGALAYKLSRKPAPVATPAPVVKQEAPKPAPKPTTVASPLTGVQVKPEVAQLPVTGIMIENSPDARPQSGLKDAGVVYEAIAEGGITRFLALFQDTQPDYVGPVRSVRPYYIEWLQGYDAGIAHVGGSPEALALIKSAGVKDLDQFFNTGPYRRVSNRYAPHNMYTDVNKLIDLQKSKGYTKSTFTGFARKPAAPSATPNAQKINITLSGYLYNVQYDYDKVTNTYKRSEGGKPHLDERSGAQLAPNVVVVIVVPYGIKSDGLHSDYATTGSGKAFIFQDGIASEGTWEKKGSKDPLRLGDSNGAPIGINPGQTWVTAVGTAGSVAYK